MNESRADAAGAGMSSRAVSIGLVQMNGAGTREENLDKATRMAEEAQRKGANIVCFPELFSSPWFPWEKSDSGRAHAEDIDGPTAQCMRRVAKRLDLVLVVSLFERAGDNYFNTALLVDSDGTVRGTYRKNHIPDVQGFYESHYYGPSQLGFPVFDVGCGRIGLQICSDLMVPDGVRLLGLKGAELVCAPRATDFFRIEQWRTVMQAEAITSGCFIASANRCGKEGDVGMGGMSLVVHPQGRVMAEAGSREEVIVAQLDLDQVREYRARYPSTLDARPDLYAEEYAALAGSGESTSESVSGRPPGSDRDA
ncbi:MAG: acyltransferase [Alphaproteobacteria bacterium]|nr:acyltransferase [Alphaproteobacteria bacterium]